jgi:hypothetical protein
MARSSDIRIILGKTFPLTTIRENINFIKCLMQLWTGLGQHGTRQTFMFAGLMFHLTDIDRDKILLNDHVFQKQDLNRAINEFITLESALGDIPYTDLFFKDGSYPAAMKFTVLTKASLNAKLYAAAMKRIYNWYRFGSDNPIYINHLIDNKLGATASITDIDYVGGRPVVQYDVIQNDTIIHSGKFTHSLIVKTEAVMNRTNPNVEALAEVKTLLEQVSKRLRPEISLYMFEKISMVLLSNQQRKNLKVTLETDSPHVKLIAENDPELGGVQFSQYYALGLDGVPLNSVRISIHSLINGFALLRQEYGDEYMCRMNGKVTTKPLSPTTFGAGFFIGRDIYRDILESIRGCMAKGHTTFSHFDSKGIKVRYVTWSEGRPYYSIECYVENEVYVFDTYFSLNKVIEEAKQENEQVVTKPSFFERIKQVLTLFA